MNSYLSVLQYHSRQNTLDNQIKFLDELALAELGEWLRRKYNQCEDRRATAEKELRKNRNSIETLREEWKKQVAAQTKPIPSKTIRTV